MPKANFWIVMSTKGNAAVHRAFDKNSSALDYVKAHPLDGCVMLGGKTLALAAEKCHGRIPTGTAIPIQYELECHKNRFVKTIAVPDHGPVTIEDKRKERAARKADKDHAPKAAASEKSSKSVSDGAASASAPPPPPPPREPTPEEAEKARRLAKDMRRWDRKLQKAAEAANAAAAGTGEQAGLTDGNALPSENFVSVEDFSNDDTNEAQETAADKKAKKRHKRKDETEEEREERRARKKAKKEAKDKE